MNPENENPDLKALPIIQDPHTGPPPSLPQPDVSQPDDKQPDTRQPDGQRPPLSASPTLIIGISITLLGIIIFLSEAGIPYADKFISLWPLTLIVLGYIKLRQSQNRSHVGAWVLIGLGTLFLLDEIPGLDFGDLVGPLIVTGTGVAIMLHAIKRQRGKRPASLRSEACISGQAIFSSLKHRHPRSPFEGGDVTSIFGSAELDLRDAVIEEGSVTLECFVMFGGCEIRVPENWDVRVQASAIFGGIENKSTPASSDAPNRPILILSGLVLFGGVEVRS